MLASDYTDSHDFIPNLEKTFLAKTPRRKEIPLCVLASLREMSFPDTGCRPGSDDQNFKENPTASNDLTWVAADLLSSPNCLTSSS